MNLCRKTGFWLAACLLALPAWATDALPRHRPLPPPPRLVSTAAELPIVLQSLKVETEISGGRAQTTVDLLFFNPNRRILEGELQFPLLEGQQITGFALDIDGKLRPAVPVEKARGRAVFEDVIRTRVDPALLEKTEGNQFRLRVYPLPAQGTRRVVIRYSEILPVEKDQRIYRLPLTHAGKLDGFALQLRVNAPELAPVLAGYQPKGLAFAPRGLDYEARVERRDFAANGQLEIRIPLGAKPETATQRHGDNTYFVAEVPGRREPARARTLPHRIGLVWDASGSGAQRDHTAEMALLEAYFRQMKQGTVTLTRLRERAEKPQVFTVRDGQWEALRKALETTGYDGATHLGEMPNGEGVDELLLVSDGLHNFGPDRLPEVRVPLFAVSAAAGSDPTRLRLLAERSGGRFIDLKAHGADNARTMLLTSPERMQITGGEGVRQLLLASPYPEDGRWLLAGELTAANGRVRLTVTYPSSAPREIELTVREGQNTDSQAAALWARLRLGQLEAEPSLNRGEIRRLGMKFALPTRATSLIVLDRVQDYARHEIDPPAELKTEYDRLRSEQGSRLARDRQQQLDRVITLFGQKREWWTKDFPKDTPPRPPVEHRKSAARPEGSVAALMMAPTAAPPPAAAERRHNEARPEPATRMARAPAPAAPAAAGAPPMADGSGRETAATIRLQAWTPDAPYVKRLQEAPAEHRYRIYLDEKPSYAASTAFYLDVAGFFLEQGDHEHGVRILSNLAEMGLEDRHVLRVLGNRLLQAKLPALAIPVLERVRELAPDEPQSYRDLGLALAANGQYQAAIDTLYEVVVRPWHDRFPEIELITLAELNALIAAAPARVDTSRIDPRLLHNLPLDLRAVMTWDADNTDIDLHVTDPNGEVAFFGKPLTYQGGRMSRDFTGGYGPEEFSLRRAKPGVYRVEAHFFGHSRQMVTGATTLQLKLTTHFGTARAREETVTLRLKDQGGRILVGEFTVGE